MYPPSNGIAESETVKDAPRISIIEESILYGESMATFKRKHGPTNLDKQLDGGIPQELGVAFQGNLVGFSEKTTDKDVVHRT